MKMNIPQMNLDSRQSFHTMRYLVPDDGMMSVLGNLGSIREFRRLETLCRTSEPADFLGLIIEGKIAVSDASGAALALIEAGDVFGELGFLLNGSRTADLVAVEDGSFLHIGFSELEEFLAENPIFENQWLGWLNLRLAHRLSIHTRDIRKYVALVAHNEKKETLTEFVMSHCELLAGFELVATATTARCLLENTGLAVSRSVSSGPLGGDMAIGSLITTNNIRAVIFMKDPLTAHPHQADIEALSRLCDVYDVPLATNPASAELVLRGLRMGMNVKTSEVLETSEVWDDLNR